MTSMGFQALAGRIPGERIATVIHTASSVGAVTSETEVASITAALVSGRTYRVTVDYPVRFTVATDMFDARIREDNSSGTQIQRRTPSVSVAGGGSNTLVRLEVEYTALSTGNKTFSFTIARMSGTGSGTPVPSATAPGYMYVDYIRG